MLSVLCLAGIGFCAYRYLQRDEAPAEAATFSVPSAAHSLAALAVVKARLIASGAPAAMVASLDPVSDLLREGQQL